MAAEDITQTSNLVEFTYQSLYHCLCGQQSIDAELLAKSLKYRIPKLKTCYDPFPKPSLASSKAIKSGNITLADGVTVKVDNYQQDLAGKISDRLSIDEIEAFIILRSFSEQSAYSLSDKGEGSSTAAADINNGLLDLITKFYFEERLFLLRLMVPLLRAQADPDDAFHTFAVEIMREAAPDLVVLAGSLISHYDQRTRQSVPLKVASTLTTRLIWAKQILREQIKLIEVTFWTTYNLRCPGSLVASFYEAVYSTSLGATQANSDIFLDTESTQLLSDLESIIIITAIQILNIDLLYDQPIDLETPSVPRHGYLSQPTEMVRIHNLVLTTPQQPRFSPIILAWTCVIRRIVEASESKTYSAEYTNLIALLAPVDPSTSQPQNPVWQEFTSVALNPAMGLFDTLRSMLASPLFSTEEAAKRGSALINSNDIVVRAILKSLLIALTELIRVEYIEDFDSLLEVWITLFGSSEWLVIAPLCAEFWTKDVQLESRRALLEMTRDRFPVQARPLIRMLRALSATGDFKGLDGFVSERDSHSLRGGSACASFEYFHDLPTFTQVISPDQANPSSGSKLYDVRNTITGVVYSNLRPLRLPGGSILPARSTGRVISDAGAGSPVVVLWQHQHSGWRLGLGILKEYVKKRQVVTGGSRLRFGSASDGPNGTLRSFPSSSSLAVVVANTSTPLPLSFDDIGVDEGSDNPQLISDFLELFQSVLRNNLHLAPRLIESMQPDRDSAAETDGSWWEKASIIEVIPLLLQDALQSTPAAPSAVGSTHTKLLTNIVGVMSSLLPHHPGGIWTSLRNSSPLFGDARQKGTTPSFLAFERVVGSYPMTLALIDLVQALYDESQRKMYTISAQFRAMKTELLLRGLAFLHNEIWLDYLNWKYTSVGEKFQIGTKITSLFTAILIDAPAIALENDVTPPSEDPHSTLTILARFVLDAFFIRSNPSTINPIITLLSSGQRTRDALHRARRSGDAHYLDQHIEASLRLCRLVLVRKAATNAPRASLLEQGLLIGATSSSLDSRRRSSPVDVIARHYVQASYDLVVQLEAVKLLTTLCFSISTVQPSPPSLVGHLTEEDRIVSCLLTIVRQSENEPALRLAIWTLISAAVDTQPALAALFLSGKINTPASTIPTLVPGAGPTPTISFTAIDAAEATLHEWKSLWDSNPSFLAATVAFLDLVWQHAHEHSAIIDQLRKKPAFWQDLFALIEETLGEVPAMDGLDGLSTQDRSQLGLHRPVSFHSYRAVAKAHVINLLSLELTLILPSSKPSPPLTTPSPSQTFITSLFGDKTRLNKILAEAISSPANPNIEGTIRREMETAFPLFSLESVRVVALPTDRLFGNDYLFAAAAVDERLHQYADGKQTLEKSSDYVHEEVLVLNLEWSLTDSHIALTRSWIALLKAVMPIIASAKTAHQAILATTVPIATSISEETRPGQVMAAIHAERLQLLLGLLEAIWPYTPTADEVTGLVAPVQSILSSDVHRPLESVSGLIEPRFHPQLLQIIYYCVHKARVLPRPSLSATKRAVTTAAASTTLQFVIDALRTTFDSARESSGDEVDEDMGLLVALFEECIQPDSGTSQAVWLSQLQTTGLIRSSLDLLTRVDFGLKSPTSAPRSPRYPYYTRHILQFHLALASLPASAERLAHEGAMVAYSANALTPILEVGAVDVAHVAHHSWCTIVAIITNLISTLGASGGHFVNAEIVGFVQLYGTQLSRMLSWRVGDVLTLPLIQEMDAVTAFFHAIAISTVSRVEADEAVKDILRAYTEKALFLLQQLNAALSYPNQLMGSLEPMTPLERSLVQKEHGLGRLESTIEFLDQGSHPFLAAVVQRFLVNASALSTTLAIISGSDKVLSRAEVPLSVPLVSPSSKVSLDEAATIGTLIELGNWAVRLLIHLLKTPATTSSSQSFPTSLPPFDRKQMMTAAGNIIESLMTYSATQLFQWLKRDGLEESGLGNGEDEMDMDVVSRRRGGQKSMTRMGGGSAIQTAVQDQARDLSLLATRAKEVLGKLAGNVGVDDGGSGLILLEVLVGFVAAKLLEPRS